MVLTIILFATFCSFTQSQDYIPPAGELNIFLEPNTPNNFYDFKMEIYPSDNLCWDADADYPDVHNLTQEFNVTTITSDDVARFFFCGFWSYGLRFGLSNYKVSISKNGNVLKYFYIDYTTSDLPENFNSGSSNNGDINLVNNINSNKLYFHNTQTEFPSSTTIWDLKFWIQDIKVRLEPLPPQNLRYGSVNNHPMLEWDAPLSSYFSAYELFRNTGSGWFSVVITNEETTNYLDGSIDLSSLSNSVSYKARSINIRESVFSNIITIDPNQHDSDQLGKNNLESNLAADFMINQNYPNPFNPLTTIVYSVPELSKVSLKIYDLTGSEVLTLIDEVKEPGNYKLTFNAQNLS